MNRNVVTLGVVYHEETLTMVARRDDHFAAPEQHQNVTDGAVLADILTTATKYRHNFPMFHIFGEGAPRVLDQLYRAKVDVAPFDWFARTNSRFANRGSLAVHELKEQVACSLRTGITDAATIEELEHFGVEIGSGASQEYRRPAQVAEIISRWPARALALLLANQYDAAPAGVYRPLAGGYVQVPSGSGGHNPFSDIGHDPMSPYGHKPF